MSDKTQTRIYLVTTPDDNRLVEAASAAQAIRHCVRGSYAATVASPKEIAAMRDVPVEVAGKDDAPK